MLLDNGQGRLRRRLRAAGAYLLADDKKAFRDEPWVDDLINADRSSKAEEYDNGEQWLKALRLYSDLGSVEPANPLWKEKLKLATRRVRLLALYTPDVLKDAPGSEIEGARGGRRAAQARRPAARRADDQAERTRS